MSNTEIAILDVRNLSIFRPSGDYIVKNLSFSLNSGQTIAIVGQSGIGKSSILNVMAGFVRTRDPTTYSPWHWFGGNSELIYVGEILIDSQDIGRFPPECRPKVGMVMQGGIVYEHLSVLENVTYPLRVSRAKKKPELHLRARELLREVELFSDLDEAGLAVRLAEKAGALSGGERQRVALARALAKDPKVFLLDEAFANLDPVLRRELQQRFSGLISGRPRCAVIVTHDLSDLTSADRILLLGLCDGRPGHRIYQRRSCGGFLIDEDCSNGSSYWNEWHSRIVEALDRGCG